MGQKLAKFLDLPPQSPTRNKETSASPPQWMPRKITQFIKQKIYCRTDQDLSEAGYTGG